MRMCTHARLLLILQPLLEDDILPTLYDETFTLLFEFPEVVDGASFFSVVLLILHAYMYAYICACIRFCRILACEFECSSLRAYARAYTFVYIRLRIHATHALLGQWSQ